MAGKIYLPLSRKNSKISKFPKSFNRKSQMKINQIERKFRYETTPNFDIPCMVVFFSECPENATPFVTGKFRKFESGFFYRMKGAQGCCCLSFPEIVKYTVHFATRNRQTEMFS